MFGDKKPSNKGLDSLRNVMKAFIVPQKEQHIPYEILDAFTSTYEHGEIWKIHSHNDKLIVFLYTEKQINNQNLLKYSELKEDYLILLHDYLNPFTENVQLKFDSKENFETKYDGNWLEYYNNIPVTNEDWSN